MAKTRYGNELHPVYSRWLSTVQRCENPKHISYKNYGARGITIAANLRSFEDYRNYVTRLPNYDSMETLDRIKNDLGYQKGNLRWTNHSVQIANQRYSGKGFNKYTGVNWSKTHNRWVARLNFKGKCLFSKICFSEKEAFEKRLAFIRDNDLPHTQQVWLD